MNGRTQNSRPKLSRRLQFFFDVCLVLCMCAAGAFWILRVRGDKGIAIKPEEDRGVGKVVLYGQKDKEWSDDNLGSSAYSMRNSGCLTTCIASALSAQWESDGTGRPMTPGELNELFGEQGVYNDSGDILWDNLREALPQAEVLVASSVSAGEIDRLLAQGRYPVVKVKVSGHGAQHWVLLVGSEDGEYLCMDPLLDKGELVPLSAHGRVVYRMRCVYWRE